MKKYDYLIGIDEAGRGPLAGPLVVAGVAVSAAFNMRILAGIKDSKKLTERQREKWHAFLTKHSDIRYAVSVIAPAVIDSINILKAAHQGADEVYAKLNTSVQRCTEVREVGAKNMRVLCHALLDGSLKLVRGASYEVIIRGDEKVPIISAASVIAKVTRDRIMKELHDEYPEYGFDKHKGYGTKAHAKALRKFGRSAIHRKSFKFDRIDI